ncbi:mucin-5AC [Drosophila albomicans]|uniref:Mucin-5AC n=1 Tax=Drosophila albomicans TaxID=7291 RepID=A0A6P8W8W0_DROAB|nr:mucin-5AC [Drosophila albomicans]
MTRMPMIAVIALLLLQVTTSTLGKPTAASPAAAVEEETTSFGELDVSTVTMKIDLDLILSTEDNQNPFTHLPENEFASTEEPLLKSVLLQLEAKNATANLIESTTTTTTTNSPEAATTIAIESAKNELHSLYTEHDLEMRENKAEAAIETTTFLPQFEVTATPENNLAFYAKTNSYESNLEDTTTYLPMDNYKYTSGPLPADAEKYGTEVAPAEENTWIPNFDGILHSTQADDGLAETTPAPENTNNQTESSISNNVPIVATTPQPVDIGDLLRMMSSDVITDKIMQESTTEEPKLEATTNKLAEQTAETTIAPPKQQSSTLEAIVMTTFRAPVDTTTVESSTAKIIEEFPVTTIEPPKETTTLGAAVTSTASPAPQTTSSPVTTSAPETTNIPETTISPVTTSIPEIISSTTSTPETTSSTAETTSTPDTTSSITSTPKTTSSLSLTEDIVETTIEPPKQQSVLAAVSTTTPESVPESSTTEATTTSSSTTTTTTTTTTEPPTTTTTEPIPVVVTREPRVERIFNSDGVEVLYGYSSVVRTNGV